MTKLYHILSWVSVGDEFDSDILFPHSRCKSGYKGCRGQGQCQPKTKVRPCWYRLSITGYAGLLAYCLL